MSFRFPQASSWHGLQEFIQHSALFVISRRRKLTEVSLNFLKTLFPSLYFTSMLITDRHELLLLVYINVRLAARAILVYGLIFLLKFLIIFEDSRVSAVNVVETLNGIMSYCFKKSPRQFLGHHLFCQAKRRGKFLRNKFQNAFYCATALAQSV